MRGRGFLVVGLVCACSWAFAEAPVIRALFPKQGPVGCKIYVAGEGFSATCTENTVKFGDVAAEVTRCSPRSLSVVVPEGLAAGEVAITVAVGETVSEPATFTVVEAGVPDITELKPASGCVGTRVVISGTNLGFCGQKVTVMFGEVEAPASIGWGRVVYTRVPEVALGEVAVKVLVGEVASNELPFSVTEAPIPVITEVTPSSGAPGDLVRIQGENFSAGRSGFCWLPRSGGTSTKVLFGDTEAKMLLTYRGTIMAIVPVGLTVGTINVKVVVNDRESEGVPFEVTAAPVPIVTALDPAEGTVGTLVRIKGESLGGYRAEVVVDFNGTAAAKAWSLWGGTTVLAVVPAGATTGPVTVKINGVEAVEKPVFTVTELPAPVIDSLDPASGPLGTRVTIKGSNLAAGLIAPKVFFGEIEARVAGTWCFSPWDDRAEPGTTLKTIVPQGLDVGVVAVKVTLAGQESNAVNFEVTAAPEEEDDQPRSHFFHR